MYGSTYMWNLNIKNYINEVIYKTETDSQSEKTNLWLAKGKGCGRINQEFEIQATICDI